MTDTYTLDRRRDFEKISIAQWDKSLREIGSPNIDLESFPLPYRKTFKSAGYDIFSPISFTLLPNAEIRFPLGFKVYMMDDECFMIYPRSGLGFTYYARLANSTGIIDSDYYNNPDNEGHCWIKLRNEGNIVMSIDAGKGIAQGIFQKYLITDTDSSLKKSIREGGFGHTG